MRVRSEILDQEQVTAGAEAKKSVEQMAALMGCSEVMVGRFLARWVRRSGTTDIRPWVSEAVEQSIGATLDAGAPPTATQLSQLHGVPMWQVALIHAARWNARHPVASPLTAPLRADGQPDLVAMCRERWTLPQMVQATGLHPGTLEMYVAEFLAAELLKDPAPWLDEAQVAQVSALLDAPNAYYAVRRAQARSEVSRGQVAILRATRGEWRPRQRVAGGAGGGENSGSPLGDSAAAVAG